MSDFIGWIVVGAAAVFAWLWSLRGARKQGESNEQLRNEQAARERREQVNEADKHTDSVSTDDKRDSLRQRASRD